jgi:hypothetical protein
LFKHEFLATWRQLATIVGSICLVSCMMLVLTAFNVPFLGMAGQILATVGFAAIAVVVPIVLAVNYWRTMYAGPGYLTHAVPVRGRVIFAAKATYALVATLLAAVLGLALAVTLPAWAVSFRGPTSWGQAWREIWRQVTDALSTGQIGLIVAVGVAYILCQYLQYLCAITLGTRGALGRLGVGGVVIALVGLYLAGQIVTAVTMVLVPWSVRLHGAQAGSLTVQSMGLSFVSDPTAASDVLGLGWLPMGFVLAVVLIVVAIRSIERHTCLR